jgi:hypothetical protein
MNESIYLSLAELVRKNVYDSVLTSANHPAWHSSVNNSAWRSVMVVRRVVQNSVEHSVSQSIEEMNDQ